MAFATAHTIVLRGAEGHLIDVQVDVSPGLVSTTLVGRADKGLSEARDRVRMAINNDGGRWPATKRVTILLAPADLPKAGTHLDLAIALAIVSSVRDVPLPARLVAVGELSLAGEIRPASAARKRVAEARRLGYEHVLDDSAVHLRGAVETITLLSDALRQPAGVAEF